MKNRGYLVTEKNYGQNYPKKSRKLPKFSLKIFSRIFWGMNIAKTDCPLTKTLIRGSFSAILINSCFILFSENRLKLFHFLRLCNRSWRNRTWRHRSSGSRNGQFRAWPIWYWKPFGYRWSTIKAIIKLEWHDFGLSKIEKMVEKFHPTAFP